MNINYQQNRKTRRIVKAELIATKAEDELFLTRMLQGIMSNNIFSIIYTDHLGRELRVDYKGGGFEDVD